MIPYIGPEMNHTLTRRSVESSSTSVISPDPGNSDVRKKMTPVSSIHDVRKAPFFAKISAMIRLSTGARAVTLALSILWK
jgi:hypothetical protein